MDETNTEVFYTATATDEDGDNLSFSLTSDGDSELFDITAAGELRFLAAVDFENPSDANQDNVYEITVVVSDGSATESQTLVITVNNVEEVFSAQGLLRFNGQRSAASASVGGFVFETPTDIEILDFGSGPQVIIGNAGNNFATGVISVHPIANLADHEGIDVDSTQLGGFDWIGNRSNSRSRIGDLLGASLDFADINGDGQQNLIYSASTAEDNYILSFGRGEIYIMPSTTLAELPVSDIGGVQRIDDEQLLSENRIIRLRPERNPEIPQQPDDPAIINNLGRQVVSAGDLDGDGRDELLVLAGLSSFLLYGNALNLSNNTPNIPDMLDNNQAIQIDHESVMSRISEISGGQDIDGDNVPDLVYGAMSTDPNSVEDAGSIFIISGQALVQNNQSNIILADIAAENLGYEIGGVRQTGLFGQAIEVLDDFNGDGRADLLVNAQGFPEDPFIQSEAYVIYGTALNPNMRTQAISDVLQNSQGRSFLFDGADLERVESVQDIDGDGNCELIFALPTRDSNDINEAGIIRILMSRELDNISDPTIDLFSADFADLGITIAGRSEDDIGFIFVEGEYDFDGDGVTDIIFGFSGGAYVISGSSLLNLQSAGTTTFNLSESP